MEIISGSVVFWQIMFFVMAAIAVVQFAVDRRDRKWFIKYTNGLTRVINQLIEEREDIEEACRKVTDAEGGDDV